MKISYTTNRRDLLALATVTYLRSPWTYVLLGVFVVATLPGTIDSLPSGYSRVVTVLTAITMVTALIAALLLLLIATVIVSTLVAGNSARHLRTMTISSDSLVEQAPDHSVTLSWAGIHNVRCTRSYIFVYTNPRAAYPIPRRSVESDEEWTDLCSMVRELWSAARA